MILMKMSATKVIISYPWISKDDRKDENDNKTIYYPCKELKEFAMEIARKELREDQMTRDACLEQFREWIRQNQDIENCITDDNFLLRFLRMKKYSLPMAQQMLLKYLNLRCTFKHLFFNLDYKLPNVYELIDNGYVFASPFRDAAGRRVIIGLGGNLDPHKYTYEDMARVHMLTYETLLNDENNQILGVTHFGDGKGVNVNHITMWPPTEFATVIKWGDQSFPMRHKHIFAANVPSALKYILDFTCSRLSQKLANRVKLFSDYNELYNHLEARVLPKEFGGEMPMAEMIELWKQELAAGRNRLLSYDKMNLLSDKSIIRKRDKVHDLTGTGSLPGSFRKLEVD